MGGTSSPQQGRTAAGLFVVPRTSDMFVTLSSPSRWGPAELFTIIVMACHASLLFCTNFLPLPLYVAVFAFWRFMYNAGLGLILTAQSRNRSFTRWLDDAPRGTKDLVKWMVTASLGSDYNWSKVPLEFNAWIAFRAVAMVVLANDGLSYLVLAAACFKPVGESSATALVASAVVGTALNVFSIWSKAAAHDCVGDFAWYWGDFFFLMEGELTFSGVFELFPHPMYTVGYSAYYGVSLICRSYTLLFVSLLAHSAQILFLIFVEEPHIRKVYGSDETEADSAPSSGTVKGSDLSPSSDMLSTSSPTMVGCGWPSLFRVGDIMLYSFLAVTSAVLILGRPSAVSAVFWLLALRVVHWGGLGSILRWQASDNWFVRRANEEGLTASEAFSCWKQLWNTSWVLNHVVFALVSLRVATNPYPDLSTLVSPVSISHILGGAALVWVAIGTGYSAYKTLGGPYGFFYTNFFESDSPDSVENPPAACYKGVFRYVNNPECVLGSLAYYGLAILLKSWLVFILAFICQAAHAAFIVFVEMPHLGRTHNGVRDRAALERTIRKHASVVAETVPVVGVIRDKAQLTAVRSKNMLTDKQRVVASATTRMLDRKEQLLSEISLLNNRLFEHKLYLRAIEIQQEASTKFKSFDGEGIVSALERRGIAIERVNGVAGIGAEKCSSSSDGQRSDANQIGGEVGSTISELAAASS